MDTVNLKYIGTSIYRISLKETGDQAWIPGETYALPANNDHVKSLIKKGYLMPVQEPGKEPEDMSAPKQVKRKAAPKKKAPAAEKETEKKSDPTAEKKSGSTEKGSTDSKKSTDS